MKKNNGYRRSLFFILASFILSSSGFLFFYYQPSIAMLCSYLMIASVLMLFFFGLKNLSEYRQAVLEQEKKMYKEQTYRSLESAKYEIEKMSHRLLYLTMLVEKDNKDDEIAKELAKFKIQLKNASFFIHTGNTIFDFMMTREIKNYFSVDDFKSQITISVCPFYDQSDFILLMSSLLKVYAFKEKTELFLTEKAGFVVIDFCCQDTIDKQKAAELNVDDMIWYTDGANREHLKMVLTKTMG